MNRVKAWIRSVFGFSRAETNGFLFLLPLLLFIVFSEPIYRYWIVSQPIDRSKDAAKLDSLLANLEWEKDSVRVGNEVLPFMFNPNSASANDFERLGFHPYLASRIINYRLKKGKFLIKEDLLKMYGMDTAFYQQLYKFIDLPERKPIATKPRTERKQKIIATKIDLNLADTSQLIKLYGIGKKLSERIVKYRDRLGGFIVTSQLKEVYGLDSAVIKTILTKYFIENNFTPKQLNINSATEAALKSHPYVSNKLAKLIVAYRFQHGKFKEIDDLLHIRLLTENEFEKVKAYLTTNP
jgi:competence protein ComEA